MEDFTMEFKENTDFDLIGLGEVMLRLSPPNKEKISQSETFEKNAGGKDQEKKSREKQKGEKRREFSIFHKKLRMDF